MNNRPGSNSHEILASEAPLEEVQYGQELENSQASRYQELLVKNQPSKEVDTSVDSGLPCIVPHYYLLPSQIPVSSNLARVLPSSQPQGPIKTVTVEQMTQLPRNSNSNDDHGWLLKNSNSKNNSIDDRRPLSHAPKAESCFNSSHSSSIPVPTSSMSTLTTALANVQVANAVSIPRHLIHWTKHQGSNLQGTTGMGFNCLLKSRPIGVEHSKKSSSGLRTGKAVRLRELTEKLKRSVPVSPSRQSPITQVSPQTPEESKPNLFKDHLEVNQEGSVKDFCSHNVATHEPISTSEAKYGINDDYSSEAINDCETPKQIDLAIKSPESVQAHIPESLVNEEMKMMENLGAQTRDSLNLSISSSCDDNHSKAQELTSGGEIRLVENFKIARLSPLGDQLGSLDFDTAATSSNLRNSEPQSQEIIESVCETHDRGVKIASSGDQDSETLISALGHTEMYVEQNEVTVPFPATESRINQANDCSRSEIETQKETVSQITLHSGKVKKYRSDASRRRKGVYITQWPEPTDVDRRRLTSQTSTAKDDPSVGVGRLLEFEGRFHRSYSKRPLRGPYGQMLETEMAKPRTTDTIPGDNLAPEEASETPLSDASVETSPQGSYHLRTSSSPSRFEGSTRPSSELLAELSRQSPDRMSQVSTQKNDTRTHVVVELYDTERSYVEALQILVNKYLQPLKNPEHSSLVDLATVDQIFYQIPAILNHHEMFLEELRKKLETWDMSQTIGDVFLDVFMKPIVLQAYTFYLDNWKSARTAIKNTCQSRPAFARFLETMEREHRGKLGLDQLLIKPVQKIPRYELLIQRLLKHTDPSHPDYRLLTAAQKEVHELVVRINCTEKESHEWEQQQTTLKEVQGLIEGLAEIVTHDRTFIRYDSVTVVSNQGTRKERALFLFSDLLVITSIKRRSGTIRKPLSNPVGILEANKYKMLMKIPLDDLEVIKAKDENVRKMAREVDHLREDCATLAQLQELVSGLHGAKQQLADLIKDLFSQTQRQLAERNAAHSQLACLELTLNTQVGIENITIIFTKPEDRSSWEESFNEAKQKLVLSEDKRLCPEFVGPLPIRKTRAGLQFTCAAPTPITKRGMRDVWVCNSDGYVGQVCILSLSSDPPQVTFRDGVCSARILSVAGVPALSTQSNPSSPRNRTFHDNCCISDSVTDERPSGSNFHLDSCSSSDSSDDFDESICADSADTTLGSEILSIDEMQIREDHDQPTMWLGTEDGNIYVLNCSDDMRIKRYEVKIQNESSVHCIIYFDDKVFVSLANGDMMIYSRDQMGMWDTEEPVTVSISTIATPVSKMLPVSGKLWCSCHNLIKVFNTKTLNTEHSFTVSDDAGRSIACMANSDNIGVWISIQNSAVLKLFHALNYECLADINIAPAVTKMLTGCDDIIRQHKAACLKVTALLAHNELLWIGTSAGVLLTMSISQMIQSPAQRISQHPVLTGIPHGHTGQVRFLTYVEMMMSPESDPRPKNHYTLDSAPPIQQKNIDRSKILVISGGEGYEDFRGPQIPAEPQAGREDSTNHILLWKL